jgi:nucleoside-diphosphate-sugar epimerase
MRLALDHHYSTHIAIRLRERGHDVVAAVERGWGAEDDEALLALCETDGRALVTNNVADFTVIARRWATQGRCHAGLVFTSDASMPRSRDTIGRYVEALDALLEAHPAENSFADRVLWLTEAPPDAIGSARQHRR